MKTPTLIFIAIGGAVIYYLTKVLKAKSEFDNSPLGQANRVLGSALPTSIYGLQIPTSGILTAGRNSATGPARPDGQRSNTAGHIDLAKLLAGITAGAREFFASRNDTRAAAGTYRYDRASQSYQPVAAGSRFVTTDPTLIRDYEVASAQAIAAGVGSGDDPLHRRRAADGALIATDFYVPPTGGGIPGRNFSLEAEYETPPGAAFNYDGYAETFTGDINTTPQDEGALA